ncbi:MAG: SufD family Fe-S cluster assembly protein [Candidatus Parvarchaeota archaeon]|jgi:Fe-S cluster assembly protein SufB/Fe-S cluster assembly protein SufD|nr:SufD family Fe-S cluster assembly protein [Candidatus Parvarchaeota archaeon]MCL5107188.1 SufD family Fe-S cluster assembly protein [Candidatus Parvarchaeota archaeon]
MKSESEPNWLLEYRKEEREAADKSNLEDRNIFLKYVEKENEMYFYDLKETEDKSNDLLRYDNETFKDKLEIKALKDLEKLPEQIYGFKDKDRVEAQINSDFSEGVIITFKDNINISKPLTIKQDVDSGRKITKIILSIGKNSKLYVNDEVDSSKNAYSGQNVYVILEEDSELNFMLLDKSKGRSITNLSLITKGKVNFLSLLTNEKISRNRLWIKMLEHSEVNIQQGLIGNNESYFDVESEIIHSEKNTKSNLNYRAVLDDSSKAVYKGVIRQEKPAVNSYAYLSEHSLVLDKNAKSISVPSLEIETNELKAYHSASSQPLDKSMLFYAMSRGLDKNTAVKMIAQGFVEVVFNKTENPELLDALKNLIEDKMGYLDSKP